MIWIVLLLLDILFVVVFQYMRTNVFIPKSSLQIIDELIKNPNNIASNNVVFGKMEYVELENTNICYEHIANKNPNAEVVLLLHGLGQTMLNFPPYFCQSLLDAGFQIVRIDHQGGGGSNWVENWGKPGKYTLEDMAKQAVEVMDYLNIKQFHLAGVSMGGMIGQRMAINYPDRIASLSSIASSAYFFDPEFGGVPKPFLLKIIGVLLAYGRNPKTVSGKIKARLALERSLHGSKNYTFDDRIHIEQAHYEIVYKRGYNPKASDQHGYAIKKSGSRLGELENLKIPTLVVHGKKDPLIIFQQAQKYAAAIPNCKTLFIDEMGHHLPEVFNKEITGAIKNHIFSSVHQTVS